MIPQKSAGSRVWDAAKAAMLLVLLSTTGYAGISNTTGSVSFGNVTVGSASTAKTITISNTGRESVVIESASLSSLEFSYSGPAMPLTLAPGQSFSGSVRFIPTAAQRYTARLTFSRSNSMLFETGVSMSGTGVAAVTPTPSQPVTPTAPTTSTTPTTPTPAPTTPTINWSAPAAITYGTALSSSQLDATASTSGSFAYSPAAGTVLKAGSQTLSATFTPSNSTSYTTATDSVTLTVNKATPVISWTAPTAITSGAALSATQLDATASVPGTFTYSPALGAVLSAGNQTLSVTFTPSDSTDYNTVTGSVSLAVNSAPPATGTITVTPASISFGNINVGATSSQSVTVKNSGSGTVTISNLSLSGAGVTASGISSGTELSSGQTATLSVSFDAASTGSVSGGVTIASNASNSSVTVPVSATGMSDSVSLSWSADSSATGGYNVYSSTTSGGPYNLLTSNPVTTPSYTDNTVQAGLTYYYVVTAINASTNLESTYSNQATASIP